MVPSEVKKLDMNLRRKQEKREVPASIDISQDILAPPEPQQVQQIEPTKFGLLRSKPKPQVAKEEEAVQKKREESKDKEIGIVPELNLSHQGTEVRQEAEEA